MVCCTKSHEHVTPKFRVALVSKLQQAMPLTAKAYTRARIFLIVQTILYLPSAVACGVVFSLGILVNMFFQVYLIVNALIIVINSILGYFYSSRLFCELSGLESDESQKLRVKNTQMFVCVTVWLTLLVVYCIYSMTDARYQAWSYLCWNISLRSLELLAAYMHCSISLVLIQRFFCAPHQEHIYQNVDSRETSNEPLKNDYR